MNKSKLAVIIAIIFLSFWCFPLRGIRFGTMIFVHSALILYYGSIMILSMYILRRLPLIWSFISSLCFTLLSTDFWELPFPWVAPLNEGVLFFILRWRLFLVVSTILIMFCMFKYEWSFWKYFALTLPGFLYVFIYPFMVVIIDECGQLLMHPILGDLPPGVTKYLPCRVISTIGLGWVLLNGEPSNFLRELIASTAITPIDDKDSYQYQQTDRPTK